MPTTVRLSRQFYDKFGDEVVNELVGVLNDVDAAYRSELREQNELNFARFDAKLHQRLAELRGDLRAEMHSMKADIIKWMFLFWAGTALGSVLLR